MSRFHKFVDEKRKRKDKVNEIVSPQMHQMLKKIGTEFTALRNQMKMDGHSKEADKIFLKFSDILSQIKKIYK